MKTAVWTIIFITLFMLSARCDQITTTRFPSIAARIDFFEPRINATDSEVRRVALREITSNHHRASTEFVSFLQRMCRDPDSAVRGYAVQHLHEMYVKVDIESLPQPIAWYGDEGGDYSSAQFKSGL